MAANFARINSAVRVSPAMAAGLKDRLWDVCDIVKLIEEMEMKQEAIYEVAMQKDGQYQVIIRRPSAVVGHVSDFRTEAEAEVWVAAQPEVKL
jgi:hypothetical protein